MVKQLSRLAVVGAMVTAAASTPSRDVAAQPVDTETETEARALFEDGLALADADRWAEALSAFRRSSSLVPRASTSYNVANALYRLDRVVEALSELDRYDRMPEVRNDPAAGQRGDTLRALLREAVGEVRLLLTPSAASLFVDGWPSAIEGPDRIVLLDPGAHSIRVTHEGYEPHRQELYVERGSRSSYSIELEARPAPVVNEPSLDLGGATVAVERYEPPLPAHSPREDDRKPFVKRPGFWVMIGVIAAAGIGAGVAIALTRNDDAPPCGTTDSCATTQGLGVSF